MHVGPPWELGKKVYINGPGHMDGRNGHTLNIVKKTACPMIFQLGMEQYVLKLYKIYINDDPGLTLTYFTTMSIVAKFDFLLIGATAPDIR